jgi:hypothetical protein
MVPDSSVPMVQPNPVKSQPKRSPPATPRAASGRVGKRGLDWPPASAEAKTALSPTFYNAKEWAEPRGPALSHVSCASGMRRAINPSVLVDA